MWTKLKRFPNPFSGSQFVCVNVIWLRNVGIPTLWLHHQKLLGSFPQLWGAGRVLNVKVVYRWNHLGTDEQHGRRVAGLMEYYAIEKAVEKL